jgi:hypothetical protein
MTEKHYKMVIIKGAHVESMRLAIPGDKVMTPVQMKALSNLLIDFRKRKMPKAAFLEKKNFIISQVIKEPKKVPVSFRRRSSKIALPRRVHIVGGGLPSLGKR